MSPSSSANESRATTTLSRPNSSTFIGLHGTAKPQDVYWRNTPGDLKVCQMYCNQTTEGSCTGTLNSEVKKAKAEIQSMTPEDWDKCMSAMMVMAISQRDLTHEFSGGTFAQESYDSAIRGLSLLHHEALSEIDTLAPRPIRNERGTYLSEFVRDNGFYHALVDKWTEGRGTTEEDIQQLSNILHRYSQMCQDYMRYRTPSRPRRGLVKGLESSEERVTGSEHETHHTEHDGAGSGESDRPRLDTENGTIGSPSFADSSLR